jgi:acylphosphatase
VDEDAARTGHVRWRVSGRVQGVGFRWFVQRAADSCGVRGDVCNLPDGRVEVRAEGTRTALERLLHAVREGPPAARVDEVERLEPQHDLPSEGFHIRHGG